MLTYIIPVVVVTVLFILYGILNVEEDVSSEEKPGGCEHCAEKNSCGSGGMTILCIFPSISRK